MKLRRGKTIVFNTCMFCIHTHNLHVHTRFDARARQAVNEKGLLIRKTTLMRFELFPEPK